jgi:hypothetical protein
VVQFIVLDGHKLHFLTSITTTATTTTTTSSTSRTTATPLFITVLSEAVPNLARLGPGISPQRPEF